MHRYFNKSRKTSASTFVYFSLAYKAELYVPVIATGVGYLIFYIATGCFNMNDPADSDDSDEFFDASEQLPNERDSMARTVKRVDRLEKQMEVLSGQMSTIMDKLENISITLESQPGPVNKEKTKRMRSCHARDPLRNPHPVRTPKLRRWPATQNRRKTTLWAS